MYLRIQSRAARKKREDFWARCMRRQARQTASEIEDDRSRCGLLSFWAGCGSQCRRAHACCAADPRACFEFHWDQLEPDHQALYRDFMDAFARLHDRRAAWAEAGRLFRQRREPEKALAAASGAGFATVSRDPFPASRVT